MSELRILGIETSCDETAAAVVCDGTRVLSSVISSSMERQDVFGGVVPELASRAHVEYLTPAVARALVEGGFGGDEHPDAVAATVGPGLVGALLVGVSSAKALALAWGVPFIGVNHLEGHLYSSFLEEPDLEFPLIVMLVSGGHTMLILMEGQAKYRVLGETMDDAAGEAFDKVARMMDLGYPGGPVVDRLSAEGDPKAITFPRAVLNDGYNFSFSGVKTAVMNYLRKNPNYNTADVCASFQEAVVDVLTTKARQAVREFGAKGIALGGGVAANSSLRERTCDVGIAESVRVFLPSRAMCVDNAAMIAAAGYYRLQSDGPSPLSMGATPGLRLVDTI
jgi:N6-L-threonylcarbamoyladenine synthase